MLGFLISSNWVLKEGRIAGREASDAEVKKQFDKIKNEQFPKAAEFEKFLASSGQTVSDLLLRVKLNMMSQKIQSEDRQREPQRQQSGSRKVLQRKQLPLRDSGKA